MKLNNVLAVFLLSPCLAFAQLKNDTATIIFKNADKDTFYYVHAMVLGNDVGFPNMKPGEQDTVKINVHKHGGSARLYRFEVQFDSIPYDRDEIVPMDYPCTEQIEGGHLYLYTIKFDQDGIFDLKLKKLK